MYDWNDHPIGKFLICGVGLLGCLVLLILILGDLIKSLRPLGEGQSRIRY